MKDKNDLRTFRYEKKSKYDSNNGFLTKVWGPMLWTVLHIISFNYPVNPTEEQKKYYYNFVLGLQHVLPCGACRTNMPENLHKVPFTVEKSLRDRRAFSKWMYDFHNEVNRSLGKKTEQSFAEVQEMYEIFRAKCGSTRSQTTKQKSEKGCTEPINNIKSKCVLSIVPQNVEARTLRIDKRCFGYLKTTKRLPRKKKIMSKKYLGTKTYLDEASSSFSSSSSSSSSFSS
eukprot:COSAG01_NODE_6907_length_3444_cov_2.575187_1_plen_229_part_00